MIAVVVQSFGYGHDTPPLADVTVDVRDLLRDPHRDPAFRELTGADLRVRQHVLDTDGAIEVVHGLADLVEPMLRLRSPAPDGQYGLTTVAIGCAGGRHRSYVLAEVLAEHLRSTGWEVDVEHRDVHRPVIRRALAESVFP